MKHIIVIEDNSPLAEVIQLILEEKDYKVLMCKSAGSFESRDRSVQADLLITDINLPDGNGLSICQQHKGMSDIPVLLMSASLPVKDMADSGADDFIAKPFDIIEFERVVDRLLQAKA